MSRHWRRQPLLASERILAAAALALMIAIILLGGCDKSEQTATPLPPVSIEQGDECHVCGMIISNFPGPKGEAYQHGAKVPLKFCSTRDLFTYLLQPENLVSVTQIYVHDMGEASWEHPADDAFVEGRSAWFVADHSRKGAMGPTLASFSKVEDARAFADEYGGRLLRFDEITLDILANLKRGSSLNKPD